MSSYKAMFHCMNDCGQAPIALDSVVYRCPSCNSLLEVRQDLEALKEKSPEEWKKIFDDRQGSIDWPYASGVWRYKEMVLPEINEEHIVSVCEGNSNLFWAKRYGAELGLNDLWIKQCGVTHTGSFKDLGMTVLVSQVNAMREAGKPIEAVACASTGDTSAALSAFASAAGIPSIVFLPENKISIAQLIQPVSNGSKVLSLKTDFDGCMRVVKEVTKDDSIYLANSMNSLRIEGQKTISFEICQQFNWEVPDFIIIPGGNLGNVSALAKGFSEMLELGLIKKKPCLVLAQAEQANPLYRSYKNGFKNFEAITAGSTQASAIQIGDPVSVEKAIRALKQFDGIVEQASEQELADAAARGDRGGLFNCPHTGVALAVLEKLVHAGTIKKDQRSIVISTAHGLKFSQFKTRYHEDKNENFSGKYKNIPQSLDADVDSIKKAILK